VHSSWLTIGQEYNENTVFPVDKPSILRNVLLVLVHSGEDLHYAIWVHYCHNTIAWAHMEFTPQIVLTHQATHMLPKPFTNQKIGQEKKQCIQKTDHE